MGIQPGSLPWVTRKRLLKSSTWHLVVCTRSRLYIGVHRDLSSGTNVEYRRSHSSPTTTSSVYPNKKFWTATCNASVSMALINENTESLRPRNRHIRHVETLELKNKVIRMKQKLNRWLKSRRARTKWIISELKGRTLEMTKPVQYRIGWKQKWLEPQNLWDHRSILTVVLLEYWAKIG